MAEPMSTAPVLHRGLTNVARPRAGHIGPIRREIIFEPLPDDAPTEPPVVVPESPAPDPKEPVPSRP
jgi:hypothetical protein